MHLWVEQSAKAIQSPMVLLALSELVYMGLSPIVNIKYTGIVVCSDVCDLLCANAYSSC